MNHKIHLTVLAFVLGLIQTSLCSAGNYREADTSPALANVIADLVVVRPLSFGLTVGGTAIFVGLSPIIGMATIAEPHDAFDRAGDALVGWPARFTFMRPLGDMTNPSSAPKSKDSFELTTPSPSLSQRTPSTPKLPATPTSP